MTTSTGLPLSISRKAGTAARAEAMPPQKMTRLAPNRSPRRPPRIRTGISTMAAIMPPSSISWAA